MGWGLGGVVGRTGGDLAPAKVYGWWNGPSFVLRRACQIPIVNMYSDNRRDLMSGLNICLVPIFLRELD